MPPNIFLIKLVKFFLEKNLKNKDLGLFNNQNLIGKKLLKIQK